MPLKIIPTPDDPNHSRRVVYVPDPYDVRRADRSRPYGSHGRNAAGNLARISQPTQAAAQRDLIVGLDLGQAADFTALAVIERTASGYTVPALNRTRDLPYPEVVATVAGYLALPDMTGARLVIDATGVGRPVLDLFRASGLDPTAVTITGADRATGNFRSARVPKRDLVNVVLLALQANTLHIPAELPHAATLGHELAEVRRKISANGHDSYGVWREGEHDDLVLALALALWLAERGLSQTRT
jgi:hypothetical protein